MYAGNNKIKGTSIPSCPITRRQPTTMSRVAFEAICGRYQSQKVLGNYAYKYCHFTCKGKTIPAELTIKDIKGEIMAEKRECEVCGRKSELSSHHGLLACAVCQNVLSAVKMRPEGVVTAIRHHHDLTAFLTEEEVAVICGKGDTDNTALQQEMDEYKARATELAAKCRNLQDKLDIANLGEEQQEKRLAELTDKLDKSYQQTSAMAAENERLKKELSLSKAVSNNGYDKGKLMDILLDISQAHIDGRVLVKSDHFKELRKAATA